MDKVPTVPTPAGLSLAPRPVPISRFALNETLTAALRRIAADSRCTPWMVAMAAFQIVLRDLSSQNDRTVLTLHCGRTRAELAQLLGCFLDYWLLRIELAGDPTFLQVLMQVRNGFLDAVSDFDIPYRALEPELTSDFGDQRRALVLFNYMPDSAPLEAVGSRGSEREIRLSTHSWGALAPEIYPQSNAMLVGEFSEVGGRLVWKLLHGRMFDGQAMNAVSQRLGMLFAHIARAPEAPLSKLTVS